MNRFVALFGGALIATGISVAAYAHDETASGKAVTIQGELIDSACFVSSDGDAKGKGHAECAAKCMKSGIPAAILPEGKKPADMMYLLTNPAPLAAYAGQTIKVEGTAHEDNKALDVKKLYVQQGTSWKEIPLQDEHHNMAGGAAADHAGHDHK